MGPDHIDGLVQDCSNFSALAMELLQSALSHRYPIITKSGFIIITSSFLVEPNILQSCYYINIILTISKQSDITWHFILPINDKFGPRLELTKDTHHTNTQITGYLVWWFWISVDNWPRYEWIVLRLPVLSSQNVLGNWGWHHECFNFTYKNV